MFVFISLMTLPPRSSQALVIGMIFAVFTIDDNIGYSLRFTDAQFYFASHFVSVYCSLRLLFTKLSFKPINFP